MQYVLSVTFYFEAVLAAAGHVQHGRTLQQLRQSLNLGLVLQTHDSALWTDRARMREKFGSKSTLATPIAPNLETCSFDDQEAAASV
jgi:hypothetical protein